MWIVDDSPSEAEMARRALASSYLTEVFPDGATLLERIASEERPDVLVLDWQLPGMNGIEVCRFLRGMLDQIALPIVMLTVQGHRQDIVEGLQAGANDYLTKPYDAAELLARVGTLVRTRRLHEQVKRGEQALAVERDRLLLRERSLALLSQASVVLASSLDAAAVSGGLARLVTQGMADYCGVFVRDEGSGLRLLADAYDGDAAALRSQVVGRAATGEAGRGAALALQSGRTVRVNRALLGAPVEQRTAWLLAPMAVQGRVVGCLALALVNERRHFDEGDPGLAEELALRAAVALENARLFEIVQRERTRAEEANRAKDEFLATVSHELRTPLNAILGWVVMLRGASLPEERRARALETIERNARVQIKLIEDLLDIGRIISGKLRLSVAPLFLSNVVEAAIETTRPAAEAKEVAIDVDLDAASQIAGDAERLQQVAWNLMANAVKFTPRGGHVRVRLTRHERDVELVVSDTGQGIAPAFLPHVFEQFRQADASIGRVHGGLGLGLAITRHLVELHGGEIEARSEGDGQGASFLVRLPLTPRGVAEPRARPSSGPPSGSPLRPPQLQGLRVLLVEDEQDTRDLVVSVLSGCGAEVTAVKTSAEALASLDALGCDVLVSDLGLPGDTGYDLIQQVRARPVELGGLTPAVALTAYTRMEDRAHALSAGFDRHIPKPFDLAELLLVVAQLTGRRASDPG